MRSFAPAIAALFVASACTEDPASLIVSVETDLVASRDFDEIAIAVDGATELVLLEEPSTPLPQARLEGLVSGRHLARVALRREGDEVVAREFRIDIDGVTGVLVRLTASCAGVACDDGGASCLDGRCVADGCLRAGDPACPVDLPECSSAATCESGSCFAAACVDGSCRRVDAETCALGYCDLVADECAFDAAGAANLPGLVAVYDFQRDEGMGGTTIADRSGQVPALDLTLEGESFTWTAEGLHLDGSGAFAPIPERLYSSLAAGDGFSISGWVTPDEAEQSGPARIVTLSRSYFSRFFTVALGTAGDLPPVARWHIRVFTSESRASNGQPFHDTRIGSVSARPTHFAAVYQNGVGLTFYVDGVVEPNIGEEDPSGTLNWIPDEEVRVAIGDEVGEIVDYPRTFHGTYHRLLLFTRALDPAEVAEFAATPY